MSNSEDKAFFSISAIAGTLSNVEIFNNQFYQAVISALIIAFISGVVGLFAKKLAEIVWNKLFVKNKVIED